jgi:hypothetical protein
MTGLQNIKQELCLLYYTLCVKPRRENLCLLVQNPVIAANELQ